MNFFREKKVLITGHTGFKGSWLLKILCNHGAQVLGYSLASRTSPSLYEEIKNDINFQSVISDINDFCSLRKNIIHFNPDFIFHLAAQPLVRSSYIETLETFNTNIIGTANLLESCKELKKECVVVCVTTDKVYQNNEWIYPYRETDMLGGHDPYSASKAAAELVIQSYRKSFFSNNNIQIASVRAGNVIGGGDWSTDRLIPDIIRNLKSKEKIVLRNPNSIRPWQHVLDPLFGYLKLAQKMAENYGKFNESWNFGPNINEDQTVGEVANALLKIFNVTDQFLLDKSINVHEAELLKLDISKAKDRLGWIPVWDTNKAILKTAIWYDMFYKGVSASELIENDLNDFLKNEF